MTLSCRKLGLPGAKKACYRENYRRSQIQILALFNQREFSLHWKRFSEKERTKDNRFPQGKGVSERNEQQREEKSLPQRRTLRRRSKLGYK